MRTLDDIMELLRGHGIDDTQYVFETPPAHATNGWSRSSMVFDGIVFGSDSSWELVRLSDGGWFKLRNEYTSTIASYPRPLSKTSLRELVEWCLAIHRIGGTYDGDG